MRRICNGIALRFGIPKGRLMETSLRILKKADLINELNGNTRSLKVKNGNVEFYILRNFDIPLFVEQNALNMGITGFDVILERDCNVSILCDLKFGYGKFVLAVPENSDVKSALKLKGKKVATKYPETAKKALSHLNPKIFVLKGSVEIAPYLSLSDAIFDIKSTGETLKQNNLRVIEEFWSTSAKLIVNKTFYRLNFDLVQEIKRRIEDGI